MILAISYIYLIPTIPDHVNLCPDSLSLPNDYIGNKNLKLEIINLFGQITYSQTINPTESFLLDLPAGNYSFKLKNSEGKIIQQNKLILLE